MDEEKKQVAVEKTPEFKYYKTQLWYRMIIIICAVICITTVAASSVTYAVMYKKILVAGFKLEQSNEEVKEGSNDISESTVDAISNNINLDKKNQYILHKLYYNYIYLLSLLPLSEREDSLVSIIVSKILVGLFPSIL